jgi:cytoskeletal protein RodZ
VSAPTTDLDERLARLAQRRAGAEHSDGEPPRKRRRRPAAASRILVAGLSISGFLAIIASIGATAPASGATTASVTANNIAPTSGSGPRSRPAKPKVKSHPKPMTTTAPTTTAPTTTTIATGATLPTATTIPRRTSGG